MALCLLDCPKPWLDHPPYKFTLRQPLFITYVNRHKTYRPLRCSCTAEFESITARNEEEGEWQRMPARMLKKEDTSVSDADEYSEDDDDEDEDLEEDDEVLYEDIRDFIDFEESGVGEEDEEGEDEDGYSSDGFDTDADVGDSLQSKFKMRQRVQELCSRVQEEENFSISARDLSSLYDFRIDKFQRLAVEGFLKGSSVVVCAPTSSGKTLIAECASAATLAMGKRLFYTTPLKALSNQKFREFRDMFGEENVGLLTGDAAVNRDASILIMTTEILRNMLYQSIGTLKEGDQLQNVSAIVLDEVHYLSDISRGTVWEETVIYCPKEVQLICLSATVANSEELAGWIAQVHGPTELVTSRRRPVPLTWHFSTRYSLSPLLNDECTKMNRRLSLAGYVPDGFEDEGAGKWTNSSFLTGNIGLKSKESRGRRRRKDKLEPRVLSDEEMQFLRRRQVPRVEETLKQLKYRGMLPAIWFIFSRKGCDTATRYLQDLQLLSDDEQRQVYDALATFRKQHPDAVRESAVPALLCGFASHHAGCLPLWKTFIEELFQKGLIKVVFATETLAAGINMPARTTVLSSLSKRGDAGHALLSSNAMLQMAGRAGRRGLDERGHVVLVQTPFEGAEEGCKLLFAGPDPLVSQFTASYGMVLNLLSSMKAPDGKVLREGRTLEEARALIEKSFGNYVGNEAKVAAVRELDKIEARISHLRNEGIPDVKSLLSDNEVEEYMALKEKLKVEKAQMKEVQSQCDQKKKSVFQPLLQEAVSNEQYIPVICISYYDGHTGSETIMSLACIGVLSHLECRSSDEEQVLDFESWSEEHEKTESVLGQKEETNLHQDVLYFVGLGSDNMWYAFTGASVHTILKTSLSNTRFSNTSDQTNLRDVLFQNVPRKLSNWEMVGKSGRNAFTKVWTSEGSLQTWSLCSNLHAQSETSDEIQVPEDVSKMVQEYRVQRRKVVRIKKEMKKTKASKEYWRIVGLKRLQDAKTAQLEKKKHKLQKRIAQMQPTGWQEFLQILEVLEEAGAIVPETHEVLPLGRVASSIRGVNELWLSLAFSKANLQGLNPAQLAAVCACLVSEGVKIRPDMGMSDIYRPSSQVLQAVGVLREQREWLIDLQNKHGVSIQCDLDEQFAGLVEAWASGVTWKELMMDCNVDEGDLARLLRRTIDLLAQIPFLPNVDSGLRKTATSAGEVMERSPISELVT